MGAILVTPIKINLVMHRALNLIKKKYFDSNPVTFKSEFYFGFVCMDAIGTRR